MTTSGDAKIMECVILLHGLARTSYSMRKLETRLGQDGYTVVNIGYPSRKHAIESLANIAVEQGIRRCRAQGCVRFHFVTHSLGGILVRLYLKRHPLAELGRVVMLGPPNHGSEIVDNLRDNPAFKLLNGPAGAELGTQTTDTPESLGAVDFELGVIAGTSHLNPWLSGYLPEPHDGKVSVESTKIEGMTDFIVLPTMHSFMMNNDAVIEQTIHFLRRGGFKHDVPKTEAITGVRDFTPEARGPSSTS